MTYEEFNRHGLNARVLRSARDLRIVESDHRVANSLSLAAAMLRMQRQQSADGAVRSAIHAAETRIVSIARFHAYLHRRDPDERVDLADLFRDILPDLGAAVGIRCLLAVNASRPFDVSRRVARQLMIVVNELALNARKHGYGDRDGGCISLELDADGEDRLTIRLADSGTGLPDGFDPGNCDGLGLKIVTSIVNELRGSFAGHTDGGAHFTITVPIG